MHIALIYKREKLYFKDSVYYEATQYHKYDLFDKRQGGFFTALLLYLSQLAYHKIDVGEVLSLFAEIIQSKNAARRRDF